MYYIAVFVILHTSIGFSALSGNFSATFWGISGNFSGEVVEAVGWYLLGKLNMTTVMARVVAMAMVAGNGLGRQMSWVLHMTNYFDSFGIGHNT